MNVTNTSNAQSASPVQKVIQKPIEKEIAANAPKQLPISDRVELSGMGAMLSALKAGKDIRADKVAQIKSQIEAGTYLTDDKLDAASHGLLDDLLK